jgi:putative hemolysin
MSSKSLVWFGILLALVVCLVYWYTLEPAPVTPEDTQSQTQNTQLANPASVNCVNLGGQLEIVNDDVSGGQVGYCHLKDGRVCEEWALMRDGSCTPPQAK